MADILAPSFPGAVPHIPGGTHGEFHCIRGHYKAKAADAVNDVVKLQKIPKHFIPIGGHIDVITASGVATGVTDVGITGDATLFASNVAIDAAAVTVFTTGLDKKVSKTAISDLILTLQTADPGVVEIDINIWGFVAIGEGVSG